MATISAQMVKELRERTGAGMMDCKKALTEAAGDVDKAIELMRKSGQAKAAKKAGRIAAEGLVAIAQTEDGKKAAMIEINSETDFVARQTDFQVFVKQTVQTALAQQTTDIDQLKQASLGEETVEQACQTLVTKIGENIQLRRVAFMNVEETNRLMSYIHFDRIGVLLEMEGGSHALAKDIAMHIAALHPQTITRDEVPENVIAREREIFIAQAQESGKPEAIIEKMVSGRIRKFLGEITLEGQPFVRDPSNSQTVGELLKEHGAKVKRFVRFEVGEGIEKSSNNFADDVKAAVKGSQS